MKTFANAVSPKMEKVTIGGWVEKVRDLGSIVFVIVSDREGELQLTFKEGEVASRMFEEAKELTPSTAIKVRGSVREADNDYGFEIIPNQMETNKAATPLPIDIFERTSELSKRIKWRTLDIRGKNKAIFQVRSLISKAFEEYMRSKEFIKVETPILSPYATEGGADVFKVQYFERESYLRQSPQLYKQLMAAALEKVFEIGSVFRAEPSHTSRHLTEFVSLDIEMAWIDGIDELLRLAEGMFQHIFKLFKREGSQYFDKVEKPLPAIPTTPFPRITFRDAVEYLSENGLHVKGKELPPKGEEILGKMSKEKYNSDFLWITDYPWEVRPFYHMKKGNTLTKSFDLLYRGEEIITGSQREHRIEILKKQMHEKGLNPEGFGYYTKTFKYGMPPHGGFACGLGRLTALSLGLDNIREATLYPRDPETLEP